jgi:hypothetical protein
VPQHVRSTLLHPKDLVLLPQHLSNSRAVGLPSEGASGLDGASILTLSRDPEVFERQLLPGPRANRSVKSVLRYRVTDYKPQEVAKLPFEFDSSIRTIRFEPSTLAMAEMVDPQVKAVIHHSMSFVT